MNLKFDLKILILITLILSAIQIQSIEPKYSFFIGRTNTSFRGEAIDKTAKQKTRAGIKTQLTRRTFITRDLAIEYGVGLATRGAILYWPNSNTGIENHWHLRYLEVPILATYMFPYEYKKFKLRVQHGISYSVLINAEKSVIENSTSNRSSVFSEQSKDSIDLIFAFSLLYPPKRMLGLDVIYRLGLRGTGGTGIDIKNNSLDVGISWNIK
ncbi:MAG: outer membrane beta-barrel protein [bacterium]